MFAFIRPVLARLAAAVIGALAAWLAAKGVDIPADTQAQLIEATIGFMLAVFGIVYAILHRLLDRRLNPADAAAPELVKAGKRETTAIKAREEAG